MSLLCCRRARNMGAAISHPQEGDACDVVAPPTMADVIRERKKKAGGAALGTLRRRLAGARRPRPDRGCEHARHIRGVVAAWRPADVCLLAEELAAGAALRDLATRAELAREPAPALRHALPALLGARAACDVELLGRGWALRAHRAVLAARCRRLRAPLAAGAARVPLPPAVAALPQHHVDAALHALYAGAAAPPCALHDEYDGMEHQEDDLDLVDNAAGSRCSCGGARRAARLLGATAEPLVASTRYLLDSGEYSDTRLVFGGAGGALELGAHRAVLAARSRYFRALLGRRPAPRVCLDEAVLPRRFARALLHAAYTDQVDLSLIARSTSAPPPPAAPASAATAWGVSRAAPRAPAAALEDAFQLYEIGRFLEMPIVVQGCEDAIAEALSADTLPLVLRWSSQPHASAWVHRQAMRFLRDEFVSALSAPGAGGLPRAALQAALASPFLQASEPAALRALLKWAGEARRGAGVGRRRREPGDAALRDLLAPLLALVRTEHIPPDHELLQQLVRRGLLPAPVPHEDGPAAAWLGRGGARPARCFLPYLDELKALLEDLEVPEAELARARRPRYIHRIPDTLYMVAAGRGSPLVPAPALEAARAVVCARTLAALRARARELLAAPAARLPPHHRHDVHRQIALRAVREMSLPDACAELLLHDMDDIEAAESGADSPQAARAAPWDDAPDCCRSGSLRCGSADSLRALDISNEASGAGGRRDGTPHSRSACSSWSRGAGAGEAGAEGARLSARVPDVAMAPNANTHLLTARDYFRHPPPWEYGGVVLQLDLGDGATHTPRPGSRAQRNSAAARAGPLAAPRRADDDELRAALELSVIRAYSSFNCRGREAARTLPAPSAPAAPAPRPDLAVAGRSRARAASSLLPAARASPSPSPRRRHYRSESGGGSSRSHSPSNYA